MNSFNINPATESDAVPPLDMIELLPERRSQVVRKSSGIPATDLPCGKASVAGSVSQRACVFCGSRVVLYPIADALHIVHGPIGCAAYTWDIRGALSSGPQLHRNSFSTDLQEMDVIYGGEKKLEAALLELIAHHSPKAAFVYSTCIVGLIGDDVSAVCKRVSAKTGIPVLGVHSEGFKGTKKDGYKAACDALFKLIGTGDTSNISPHSINILGEFNLAGETWILRDYYKRMGIEVVSCLTGDSRIEDIRRAHGAKLNLVQCSGSMTSLAKMMERDYGIPFKRVSYFGIEDMSAALYEAAKFFKRRSGDHGPRATISCARKWPRFIPNCCASSKSSSARRRRFTSAARSRRFRSCAPCGSSAWRRPSSARKPATRRTTKQLQEMADPGTIIVDDANPLELAKFCLEKDVDLFIGGVKERPIAYKLGIGFCDHNHERKEPLAGYIGMLNFAKEVYASVASPVWQFAPRRANRGKEAVRP